MQTSDLSKMFCIGSDSIEAAEKLEIFTQKLFLGPLAFSLFVT